VLAPVVQPPPAHLSGRSSASRPTGRGTRRRISGSFVFKESETMKLNCLLLALFLVTSASAKNVKVHQTGTLLRMDSAECGLDENSGKSFAGELLGTDSAHKKTHALLCQEYVLQSDHIVYRIRPRDEKHPVLLPVGEQAQFRLDKDKMKLRVEDLDNKERDYVVVSMTQRDEDQPKTASVRVNRD
jgi:hypothetical protein